MTAMSQQFHAWAHMKASQLPQSVLALQVSKNTALMFAVAHVVPVRMACILSSALVFIDLFRDWSSPMVLMNSIQGPDEIAELVCA